MLEQLCPFRKGEIAICVDASNTNSLERGKLYKVVDTLFDSEANNRWFVKCEGAGHIFWSTTRFETVVAEVYWDDVDLWKMVI